jgi:hypothetical protein
VEPLSHQGPEVCGLAPTLELQAGPRFPSLESGQRVTAMATKGDLTTHIGGLKPG